MFNFSKLHKNERGQTALEAAIILIAFIVVASVFAFAILSAGSSSTERGESAIYAGLEGVQTSMSLKGAVIAEGDTTAKAVKSIKFTVTVGSGGSSIDLTPPDGSESGKNVVTIGYRDQKQSKPDMPWDVAWIGKNDGDSLLEEGELAEITVDVSGLTDALEASTEFKLELKAPTGAVVNVTRTTPPLIEAVMELR